MDKLTIILTLKDRSDFTLRWMKYMSDQKCPYKILIADGGADKLIEKKLNNSKNYPHLNYEYIRYPYDNSLKDYYMKLTNVCERVETEYLLLADNDDFYLINRIANYINFLDSNPDYSACRGSAALFMLKSKNGDTVGDCASDSYIAFLLKDKSIDSKDPIDRIRFFFKEIHNYDHLLNYYSVFRSKSILSNIKRIYNYNFSDMVLNELLLAVLVLKEGKIKVFKQLFYARQEGTSQMAANYNLESNLLEQFIINDVFHNFNSFIISEKLINHDIDRISILKSFALFIGEWCIKSSNYKKLTLINKQQRLIKLLLMRNTTFYKFISLLKNNFMKIGHKKIINIPIIELYILKKNASHK